MTQGRKPRGLWLGEEDAEVAEIVAGGAGEDGVTEAGEEIIGVAALEEICGMQTSGQSTS